MEIHNIDKAKIKIVEMTQVLLTKTKRLKKWIEEELSDSKFDIIVITQNDGVQLVLLSFNSTCSLISNADLFAYFQNKNNKNGNTWGRVGASASIFFSSRSSQRAATRMKIKSA